MEEPLQMEIKDYDSLETDSWKNEREVPVVTNKSDDIESSSTGKDKFLNKLGIILKSCVSWGFHIRYGIVIMTVWKGVVKS